MKHNLKLKIITNNIKFYLNILITVNKNYDKLIRNYQLSFIII